MRIIDSSVSRSDATHALECGHYIGRNGKTYCMACIPLKTMPDGRLKLLVFGDRMWGGENQKIRYVKSSRVFELSPVQGGQEEGEDL